MQTANEVDQQDQEPEQQQDGHDLSDFEADQAPESAQEAAPAKQQQQQQKKKTPKSTPAKQRRVPEAAAAAAPESEAEESAAPKKTKTSKKRRSELPEQPRETRSAGYQPKRHRAQESHSTQEILDKALSDNTIGDICLRAGIDTKTAEAASLVRRLYGALTKTMLEATLQHTFCRHRKTVTLEDVRHAYKSQIGQHLYTYTPTTKADFANHRVPREKTRRLKQERARHLRKQAAAAGQQAEKQ